METRNLLLSIPMLLLAATGCTTEETHDTSLTNEKGEYAINFTGNMDLTVTKADPATTDLGTGVKAKISVYKSDDSGLATAIIDAKGYTVNASTAGKLEGDDSYTMYLAKGSYNFYAVSCNSTDASVTIPTFASGESAVLANGVDYLWAKPTSAVDVENAEKNVPLAFERKAVQIVITVEGSTTDGVTLSSWGDTNPATITPPKTDNCKMTLGTGVIAAATDVDTGKTSEVYKGTMTTESTSGYTATYTMLPVVTGKTLKVLFNVKVTINGQEETRTYTADVVAPDQEGSTPFLSGKKYTYKATLKANKITFTSATVANWTEVAGTDLTPTEPVTSGS